jgi:hypothetical protein
MSILPLAAFADLSLLSVFMLWVASSESQQNMESMVLPVSFTASASTAQDFGEDVQVLHVRWFEKGKLPQFVVAQYADTEVAGWASPEYEFSDIIWQGHSLYPAALPYSRTSRIGCGRPDYYWKVGETMQSWPHGTSVVIRASHITPFKYIQRIYEVASRESMEYFDMHFAVAVHQPPNRLQPKYP